jgi:TP901 family phage tail tape measure protein
MNGGLSKITVEIGGKIAASLGQSLKSAQMQVSSFGRNTARTMNDAATASKRSFKNIFQNDLWQQATVGATAFAGAIGLSVRAAMEFDKAMADVRKAIDFKDGEKGLRRFGNELIKLSTELPYTASQLSEIAASAGFAGYAESEIVPFTKAAARMGVAFQMTAQEAGDAMVAMRASMGLTQPQVEQLGDAINHLSDRFQGTVSGADLTEVTRRIGAIGKAAGLTAEQVAGLGAAFLASGTPTEVAATGLKNFLNALTKGQNASLAQAGALASIFGEEGLAETIKRGKGKAKQAARGVAVDIAEELAKGMQVDPEGTIKSVLDRMAKLPKDQQVSVAGALFGEESKAAIMPLLTNTKLIGQAFDLIREKQAFAGSMQKEFQNQMGTSAAQAQIFRNGINALGISIGAAILPSLNAIMKAIGPVLVSFAEFAQNNRGLVTGIVLVGGALAGLIIALPVIAGVVSAVGTIGGAIAAAGPIIAGLGTVFAVLGSTVAGFIGTAVTGFGAFAMAAGAAMLPLLPWIALIAGIGVGIYLLVKNWGAVKAAAASAWAGIQAGAGQAWSWLQSTWGNFTSWIGGIFNGAVAMVQGAAMRIGNAFKRVAPLVLAAMFPIPALVMGIFGKLPPGVQGIFNQIVAFIKQTPAKVANVGQMVIEAIINGLKAKASALFGWISGTWNKIKSFVGGGGDAPAGGDAPPGRALGGRVSAGNPYIVGERRRELFVPGMDGAIIPRVARPVTAAALAGLLAAPAPAAAAAGAVTISAPVTINASGGNAQEIRQQVELAFQDILHQVESAHRVLLND